MKNTRINSFLCLVLLCAFGITIQCAFAVQTFQNNLLKVDVYKNSLGGVKVILFTNKPYTDSVVANKKSDFEYVILMPETSNSLTVQPALSPVADVIKSVGIKTQQYENQLKGYTKITILTSKPTEIVTDVQTLNPSTYKVSESDYKELLAQAAKKKNITTVKETKREINKEIKPAIKSTLLPQKEVTQPVQKSKLSPKLTKVELPASRSVFVQKPIKKVLPVEKVSKEKVVYKKPVSVSKVIETQKNISTTKYKNVVAPKVVETQAPYVEKIKPAVEKSLVKEMPPVKVEQPKVESEVIKEVKTPPVTKMSTKSKIKGKIKKYLKIIVDNVYTVLGLALATFILLLLIVKKNADNHKKQKNIFASHLKDQPLHVTDYTEKINKDMTWNEKFQTYVDTVQSQSPDIQNIENPQENEGLDELFVDEAFTENIPREDIQEGIEQEEFLEETEIAEDYIFPIEEETFISDDNLDELFGVEEAFDEESIEEESLYQTSKVGEISSVQEQQIGSEQQGDLIKAEFAIDEEKGFYLVDFEDTTALVGHIDEEFFVLKRFEEKIRGPIQVRLDEKKENASSYMTKVGNFRGLVEVTPREMNLLIEL